MRSVTIDGSGGTSGIEADGEASGFGTDGGPFGPEADDEPLDDDQPTFSAKRSNGEP